MTDSEYMAEPSFAAGIALKDLCTAVQYLRETGFRHLSAKDIEDVDLVYAILGRLLHSTGRKLPPCA